MKRSGIVLRGATLLLGLAVWTAAATSLTAADASKIQSLLERARSLLGKGSPSAPSAEPLRESFTVNGQYRGGIARKGYQDIGEGWVEYRPLSTRKFGLGVHARIRHPEDRGKVYEFTLDMEYAVDGTDVYEIRSNNTFNDLAREYESSITKTLPFVYLMKYVKVPPTTARREIEYTVGRHPFVVRYVDTDKHHEATLYEAGRMVGKFFILKTFSGPPNDYEKLRVSMTDGTVISFIVRKN